MSSKYKIAYLISHGHTARGAFQTGLLLKLNKAGIDVVVIAKKDSEKTLESIVKEQNAKIVYFQPNYGRWDAQRSIFRTFVYQDINLNAALLEKHQRRVKGKKSSFKTKIINSVYYFLGTLIRRLPFLKRIFIRLDKKMFYNKDAVRLLKKIQVDAIISTRPSDSMESELLNAASNLKIHKVMYILSWDNITSKGVFPELANDYLTWGNIMNKELKEYYQVNDNQIYNTGVTHFDVHAQLRDSPPAVNKWVELLNLDSKNPYLLFTMSASYYAPNEMDIIEWLAKRIEKDAYGKEMQLIIRPHMINLMEEKSDKTWIDRLNKLISKRVAVDFPLSDNSLLTWYMKKDDMLKLSNLINGASICLNSGSTIAIEAIAFNKPVILTLFDIEQWPEWLSVKRIKEYIHLKKFLAFNATDVVSSLEQMEKEIISNLNNYQLKEPERQEVLMQECYKVDGLSTDRFVENMMTILNKINHQ